MRKRFFLAFVAVVVALMIPGLALAADCGKKFDSIELLIDLSASRSATFQAQSSLVDKVVQSIPTADFTTAARVFYLYPFGTATDSGQLVYEPKTYDAASFTAAVKGLEMKRGSRTPLGPAIANAAKDLAKMPGKKALVIFSDFGWSDGFGDPLAEAKALKAKLPDVCIYSLSFAETETDAKLATAIAQAGACGQAYDGQKLLADSALFSTMIQDIFAVNKCAQPKAVTISLNIQFDTAKADIRPIYHDKIKEVADFMTKYPNSTAVIEGHTDNQGGAPMNLTLSQRRAESVQKYLIDKFKIAPARLKAVGYGLTRPVADNKDEAGRQKNRRVDCVISGVTE